MRQVDYLNLLRSKRYTWLITGVAGFIGSHLLETLLSLNQTVVGLDDFSSGTSGNLDAVKEAVGDSWKNFRLIEGDIRSSDDCIRSLEGVEFILHQAAVSSVPLSIERPQLVHEVNVSGFLNLLAASIGSGVKRIVYASSSSVYGESENLPLKESDKLHPISPYAASKAATEVYAESFFRTYGLETIGLRYFNVFGKRQNPNGPYAAVIPRWIEDMAKGESVFIFGDGRQTRDFIHVSNVVYANIIASLVDKSCAGHIFNVGQGRELELNILYDLIRKRVDSKGHLPKSKEPVYAEKRKGDIVKSSADISKASRMLGYQPILDVEKGLQDTADWFFSSFEDYAKNAPAEVNRQPLQKGREL